MSVRAFYSPRDFDHYFDEIERLALAKGISKNKMVLFILKDWIDNNRRYVDRKITDFEQEEILEIKAMIPIGCKECGSEEVDKGGWRIHKEGCSWVETRRKALESLGDE